MAIGVERFEETPNPNALKCALRGGPLPALPPTGRPPLRSYTSADAAREAGDAPAVALLGIPGVISVLLTPEWVTVVKRSDASWKGIRAGISAALRGLA